MTTNTRVYLTRHEVVSLLRAEIAHTPQIAAAKEIGVSRAYLCEVLSGTYPPTGRILEFLGLERHTVYFRGKNTP